MPQTLPLLSVSIVPSPLFSSYLKVSANKFKGPQKYKNTCHVIYHKFCITLSKCHLKILQELWILKLISSWHVWEPYFNTQFEQRSIYIRMSFSNLILDRMTNFFKVWKINSRYSWVFIILVEDYLIYSFVMYRPSSKLEKNLELAFDFQCIIKFPNLRVTVTYY